MKTQKDPVKIVGGGPKKVLYTLQTIKRIGLLDSAKALKSHNACKACGLGMGGQRGGMVNEKDEFPSVCNKSIQAQSTDIQPPIPAEVFNHTLNEFNELTDRELESMGRLNTPVFKPAGSDKYQPLSWGEALDLAAERFSAAPPEQSFFYSSGRSSNEAGFVLQLMARLYGSNNVTNCSYYCHQATGVGLTNTLGGGTATVELEDLARADMVFVIGANPASNHPRFVHQLKNCRERGGKVMVINPAKEPGLVKFSVPKSAKSMLSGGTWIASRFLQPKIGSDLALLTAMAKMLVERNSHNLHFIDHYTHDFDAYRDYLAGLSLTDLLEQCGLTDVEVGALVDDYTLASNVIFAWGMGITHHLNGVDNVEAIANLAMLRGMVGKPGAGLLPLRGHSNVQGIGTIGVKPVLADDVLQAIETHMGVSLPTQKGMDTLACLRAAENGHMKSALMMGGNLFAATPDTEFARRALDNVDFKLYLTTTLNRGHFNGMENSEALILPVCARDEEPQSTTQESMFNYVRLSDGGITRLDNVRSEVSILAQLGARLLPDSPMDFAAFEQHDKVRQAIAATIPGMAPLADIGHSKQEFVVGNRLVHKPVFKTESKRGHFKTHQTMQTANTDYPYMLASIRSEGQFNSIIYEESDSYRGTKHRWCVLMSDVDCQALNVTKGSKVNIVSPQGEMTAVEVVPFDLPAGSLMVYYPEANLLIGTEHDPRSKTPAFKSVPVAVTETPESA